MFKKIHIALAVVSIGFSASAFAAKSGLYTGIELGGTRTNFSSSDLALPGADIDKNSFAGRVELGYQFGQYLALEMGYAYLGYNKFNNAFNISGLDGHITQQSGDLIGKVLLPVTHGLGLYALVGGAYVYEKPTLTGSAKSMGFSISGSEHAIRPTYGLGVSYDFNPKWTIDASWRQINSGSNIPQIDFMSGGITYHFG
jgi:opacity protein-like surface antigen